MTSGKIIVPFLFQFNGANPPLVALPTLSVDSTIARTLTTKYTLAFGTTSGLIDTIIANPYELAAASTTNFNFFDGTIPDIFSKANGLQNIKFLGIYIVANTDGSASGASITIGNAATPLTMNNGGTATYQAFTGGPVYQQGKPAGYTVDNTHKLLKVVNDDATLKITIWLIAGGVHV